MNKFIKLILLTILFAAFSGCASFFGSIRMTSASHDEDHEIMTISGMSNNSETRLEARSYRGLTIIHNKVVLTGRGPGKTIIEGNVIIKGNSCVIRNLTIRGDVFIEGNNANLQNTQILGEVKSTGNNNDW
jgi:hypothetical protein